MLAGMLSKIYNVLAYMSIYRQCIIAYMQHSGPSELGIYEKPTKVPTQHGHTNRTHEAECEPLDSRHNETRNMNMNSRVQTQNNRHEYR